MIYSIKNSFSEGQISNIEIGVTEKCDDGGYVIRNISIENIINNYIHLSFKELDEIFDMVFIDSPPVLAVTDAQILASQCSGVIFVTGYGQSEKQAVVRAKELIDKVGGKILGVVINKIPAQTKSYYTYNYDYK
jgi:hypothetical protein